MLKKNENLAKLQKQKLDIEADRMSRIVATGFQSVGHGNRGESRMKRSWFLLRDKDCVQVGKKGYFLNGIHNSGRTGRTQQRKMKLQNTCEGLESLNENVRVRGLKGYVVKVVCEELKERCRTVSLETLVEIMDVKYIKKK